MQLLQSLRWFADAAPLQAFVPERPTSQTIFLSCAPATLEIQAVEANQGGLVVPKFVKRAVLLGIVLAAPQLGWGAEHEFPVMNSIGRFWGVGYTRGGYQAAQDGRFDVVTARHPASNYRMGGLPNYSQQHFSTAPMVAAPLPASVLVPNAPDRNGAANHSAQGGPAANAKPGKPPTSAEVVPVPQPMVPAKPATPPPRWLEDYLQGQESSQSQQSSPSTKGKPTDESGPATQAAPETSPSDSLFEETIEKIEPGKEIDFSIFEAGYVRPVYAVPQQQISIQSPAVRRVNRYHR